MHKNKGIILASIILIVFVIFATVVITLFHSMRDNPIDKISMSYLWNNSEISSQYGEIVSVSRYVLESTKEKEESMQVPYSVTTKSYRIIVYVNLFNTSGEWAVDSIEIIEVHNIDN